MDKSKLSSVSKSQTLEEMGDFWDSHDFTDFDTSMPDIEFKVRCTVPIEVNLLSAIEKQAKRHGVNVETLVNLWLQQKVVEQG